MNQKRPILNESRPNLSEEQPQTERAHWMCVMGNHFLNVLFRCITEVHEKRPMWNKKRPILNKLRLNICEEEHPRKKKRPNVCEGG